MRDERMNDMMRWLSSMCIILRWVNADASSDAGLDRAIASFRSMTSYHAFQRWKVLSTLQRESVREPSIGNAGLADIRKECVSRSAPFHDMAMVNLSIVDRIASHWFDDKNEREVYCYKRYVMAHLVWFIRFSVSPWHVGEMLAMMCAPHPLVDSRPGRHESLYISMDMKMIMSATPSWELDHNGVPGALERMDDDMKTGITPDMVMDMVSFETFHVVMGYRMFSEPYGELRYVAVVDNGPCDDAGGWNGGYRTMAYFPYLLAILDAMVHEHASYADAFRESSSLVRDIITLNPDINTSDFHGIPMVSMNALRILSKRPLRTFSLPVRAALGVPSDVAGHYASAPMDELEWLIEQDGSRIAPDAVLAYDVFMNALDHGPYNQPSGYQTIDDINFNAGVGSSLPATPMITASRTGNAPLFRVAVLLSDMQTMVHDNLKPMENIVMLRREDVRGLFSMLHQGIPFEFVMQHTLVLSQERKRTDKQIHGTSAGGFILCSKDGR